MFIPIGLEQTTVRRLPWVSIGIIALNLVAFLAVGGSASSVEEEARRRVQEIVEYWQRHPYLKLPDEVLPPGTSPADRDRLALLVESMRNVPGQAIPDADEREQEQRDLDALVARLRIGAAEHPFKKWGLIPADPKPLAFLTSMFLHAGWLHLLGNMLFFYVSGPFLEDAFGRPLFALLYLSSGVAAALVHIASFPGSEAPLVGASGAIAGIMGAFLVRFVRTKIRFFYFYFFGLIRTGTVDLPAWLVLPLWFLEQLIFAGVSGSSGVAYRAHVGGFLFGLVTALVVRQLRIEEKYISPAIEKQISVSTNPALEEGMALLVRGEVAAARESFERVLVAEPRNADAHLAIWQCQTVQGTPAEGAEHLVRAIEEEVRRGDHVLALEHWRELNSVAHQTGPAPMRWRLATSLASSDASASAELLRTLAHDPRAGELAEKAARQLAALGAPAAAPPARPATPAPEPVRAEPRPAPRPGEPEPQPEPPPAQDGTPKPVPPPPSFWEPPQAEAGDASATGRGHEIETCGVESLQAYGVLMRGSQGGSDLLPYAAIETVVVGGIAAAPRPFLVLDLVLARTSGEVRRVMRLLSTEFDPRHLVNRPELSGIDAFRAVVKTIVAGAGARVVPADLLAPGRIPTFPSLEAYERDALAPAL